MMIQHSASERGYRNITRTVKHIVDDYGATPGGSSTASGDYTAFKAFHDFAIAQSDWVELIIPPSSGSSYYGTNGSYTHGSNRPFFGIPKLIVRGYGAQMNGLFGFAVANNNTARSDIHTVSAGSMSVTLIDEGDAANFSVGGMVLLAGYDLQGFGYPPNSHYNEWHRIADITGAVITFEAPLAYSYSEDWPRFFDGNAFELGGIGAAAIVPTVAGWDCEHRIYGLRSYNPGAQTYYFVRKSMLVDVKSDDDGWIAGASADMRIINQEHTTSQHEVDKLTTNALIGEYGPSNRNLTTQSSSVDRMTVRNGTRPINGTAKNMIIEGGSSPSIALGPTAYGATEVCEIRDHVTGAINGAPGLGNAVSAFTFSSGVLRYADYSEPPYRWVPGGVMVIRSASPFYDHHVFNILSITSENGEVNGPILIETDMPGDTLPAVSGVANASFLRHNAPDLTVENCTGSPEALELSLAPANSPYGIISQRTYTGTPHAANGVTAGYLCGRLVHLKINVTQAYTGVAGTLTIKLGQFGYSVINGDKTVTTSHIRVNCKIAGERVITPGGVTGEQSGDVGLSDLTGGVWMPRGIGAFFGAGSNGSTAVDVSGEAEGVRPIVTIEALTDQEFT